MNNLRIGEGLNLLTPKNVDYRLIPNKCRTAVASSSLACNLGTQEQNQGLGFLWASVIPLSNNLHLMCTLTKTSSKQVNGTVDTSSNQRTRGWDKIEPADPKERACGPTQLPLAVPSMESGEGF